ncbi:Transducin beta-like protein 3 [Blattella germanica]|nr:Transducin beta-like protein 3 [Blattella germanica]
MKIWKSLDRSNVLICTQSVPTHRSFQLNHNHKAKSQGTSSRWKLKINTFLTIYYSVDKLKFEAEEKYGAFYTGGQIEWTKNGEELLCHCGGTIKVLELASGRVTLSLGSNEEEEDDVEDTIHTFVLSADNELIVSSHKSGLLKLWKWRGKSLLKQWKSIHKGPLSCLALNAEGTILASGGTDSSVRIWNLQHQSCTYNLRGCQGVISIVKFEGELVFAAGDDSVIHAWNISSGEETITLSGHYSKVTGLAYLPESNQLVSCSRDRVIILWDLSTGNAERTIPAFECLEGVILLPKKFKLPDGSKKIKHGIHVATAGEKDMFPHLSKSLSPFSCQQFDFVAKRPCHCIKCLTIYPAGLIRIWEVTEGREIFTQSNSLVSKASEESGLAIVHLLFNIEKQLFSVATVDHNIIVHHLETFACEKQLLQNYEYLVGFTDEVLDVVLLGTDGSHIAVATNSIDIKLYRMKDMDCQLLRGHTDLVLSLASTPSDPCLLLSGSKLLQNYEYLVGFTDEVLDVVLLGTDGSHIAVATNSIDIKLYRMKDMDCQLLRGHTDLVLSLASTPSDPCLLLSGSKDNTVRIWQLDQEHHSVRCLGMGSRHTLSVGSVSFSQLSSTFFVSVSQDSCLKLWKLPQKFKSDEICTLEVEKTEIAHDKEINSLWAVDGLKMLGILRGHRRGIWNVQFSPVDQVLASSSADCSVKLWALADLSCIKTLEGHDSSVLRVEFMSQGMQLVTTGADGLLKLWSIKTSECMGTFDNHDGRVWALAVNKNESLLVTGGSDSNLVLWRDVTEKKHADAEEARMKLILQEQELANLVKADQLLPALRLALSLDRPFQVLRIVQEVLKKRREGLQETLQQLETDQKERLLNCAIVWNCNSKNCHPAQLVISVLMDDLSRGTLKPQGYSGILEGALPYTERHFKRLTQLMQDLHLLQYTAACMQPELKWTLSKLDDALSEALTVEDVRARSDASREEPHFI